MTVGELIDVLRTKDRRLDVWTTGCCGQEYCQMSLHSDGLQFSLDIEKHHASDGGDEV